MSESGGSIKRSNLLRKFVIFCYLIICVIAIVEVVVFGIYLVFKGDRGVSIPTEKNFSYQYLSDKKTDEITHNEVSIFEKLDNYENTFHELNDKSVLVSNFGEREYRCAGSCYCLSPERRNLVGATSSLTRNGMTFLLTALTLSGAYELAYQHFSDQCEEHFSRVGGEICSSESIQYEVEKCEYIPRSQNSPSSSQSSSLSSRMSTSSKMSQLLSDTSSTKEEKEKVKEGIKDKEKREVSEQAIVEDRGEWESKYWCEGFCIGNKYWSTNLNVHSDFFSEGHSNWEVVTDRALRNANEKCKFVNLQTEVILNSDLDPLKDDPESARMIFIKDHLAEICERFSQRFHVLNIMGGGSGPWQLLEQMPAEEAEMWLEKYISSNFNWENERENWEICVAQDFKSHVINPSVKCKKSSG